MSHDLLRGFVFIAANLKYEITMFPFIGFHHLKF